MHILKETALWLLLITACTGSLAIYYKDKSDSFEKQVAEQFCIHGYECITCQIDGPFWIQHKGRPLTREEFHDQ